MATSTENPRMDRFSSSSSEDDGEMDEDQLKNDMNIPEDEEFFVQTDENIQPNNMMDIFRRQSSNSNDEKTPKQSTPERRTSNTCEIEFVEQAIQYNGEMNSEENEDDEEEVTLQDNFSFLIAKGMLKPSP